MNKTNLQTTDRMVVSELKTDTTEEIGESLRKSLETGLSDDAMKSIKKKFDDLTYTIHDFLDYQLKDDLAPQLVGYVEDMAKKTVQAIISGSEDQMRRYLGCERGAWTGRSDGYQGYGRERTLEEWHPVIHGKLFEQGAVAIRKAMAEAHVELIKNERILDLEDQVKALVAQINKLKDHNENLSQRLRDAA